MLGVDLNHVKFYVFFKCTVVSLHMMKFNSETFLSY